MGNLWICSICGKSYQHMCYCLAKDRPETKQAELENDLAIANAKIQELQDDLAKEQKQTDEIVGNMVNERAEMNQKITELEQQLKDEKCFNEAGSKELNEACSRVKELEQQLKKAESVINQIKIEFNSGRNPHEIWTLDLIEQYLKSRGE